MKKHIHSRIKRRSVRARTLMLRLFIYQDSLNEPQNTRKTRKGFMNQNYLSAFLWLFSVTLLTLCSVLSATIYQLLPGLLLSCSIHSLWHSLCYSVTLCSVLSPFFSKHTPSRTAGSPPKSAPAPAAAPPGDSDVAAPAAIPPLVALQKANLPGTV